jgi:hypothetical protein
LVEGAPALVWPPCATKSVRPSSFSARPFVAWFSSQRGRPRTMSTFSQSPVSGSQVRREMTPELVSSPVSLATAMRGSLELTQTTGASAVPPTTMPVTWRPCTAALIAPSSSWFGIVARRPMVSPETTC